MAVNDRLHTAAHMFGRKVCTAQQAGQVPQNQFGFVNYRSLSWLSAGMELKLLCSTTNKLLVATN
jgi:hypothetical protein